MRPVIILFAKAPVPGRVKTRLIPPLSPAEAACLHTAFVWDIIERLQPLRSSVDIELHTDVPTDAWAAAGLKQSLQGEGDLGLKMLQALSQALSTGRARAMILGTDAPTLPVGHLERLLQSEADVALGPAEDGGFYAIACRKIDGRMFENVLWSSPDVLQRTIVDSRNCGLTTDLGPQWWDVDTPADLARLKAAGDLPEHTLQVLTETLLQTLTEDPVPERPVSPSYQVNDASNIGK